MTIAFVFPGQGSQAVGMGKALASNFSPAQQIFAEVDEALGSKLSTIIFEGPADTLTLTEQRGKGVPFGGTVLTRIHPEASHEASPSASASP